MEHVILLIVILLVVVVTVFFRRSPWPILWRVVGGTLLICTVALLYAGWVSYRYNMAVFQGALGNSIAEFKNLDTFVSSLKLNSGEALQFYISEDGKAHLSHNVAGRERLFPSQHSVLRRRAYVGYPIPRPSQSGGIKLSSTVERAG